MKMTVLLENNIDRESPRKDDLRSAHGLSLYFEWKGKKILFDTGPDSSFSRNAALLGVDISQVNMVVISHGHCDHSGGLEEFFRLNSTAPVYMHKKALIPHYSQRAEGQYIPIGIDTEITKRFKNRLVLIDGTCEITEGLKIYMNIPEVFPRPSTNSNLYQMEHQELVPDDFGHEIVMSLEEGNGSHIVTGCSHSGVLNMVNLVRDTGKVNNILSVLGGFHISSPGRNKTVSDEYLNHLIKGLKNLDTEIYTGHCTGDENYQKIAEKLGDRIHSMNTGLVREL